jgi:AcrR family transcriptional regulator
VKDPEVRREELLDLAWELCRTDGFEAMSVDQLTQVAGVAKGTFYHYFASKDAMLEALVQRFGEGLFDHLSAAAAAATGDGSERLRAIMHAAGTYKVEKADVAYATFLYQSGNLALRHRLFAAWRERARQVLVPAISDGQTDGSLSVTDVGATTDIILLLWFEAADQLWERALTATDVDTFTDIMLAGGRSIYQAQERILGVPEGTYSLPQGPELVRLTHQLYTTLDRK